MDLLHKTAAVKIKKRRRFSIKRKRKICQEWEASGLTKNKFCKQNQLAVSVFTKWCNKLLPKDIKQGQDNWLPLMVTERTKTEEQLLLEITLPNKMVLRFSLALNRLNGLLKELGHGSPIIRE